MKQLYGWLRQSKILKLLIKAGFTLGLFWLLFHDIDFNTLQEIVRNQNHAMLFIALALALIHIMLSAFRWRQILATLSSSYQQALSIGEAQKIYYISTFFSCCLPGTIGGDVIRVWLTKSERIPLSRAIHSVIIDRIIGLAGLCFLILLTLPLLGKIVGFDAIPIIPFIIVLAISGIWLLFHIDKIIAPFRHIRILHWLLYFIDSLRLLLVHPVVSIISLANAVICHTGYCLCAFVLAYTLSIDLTVIESITLIPPVVLATVLPLSVGGWGIREAGMVGILGLVGVPQAAALVLSIQLGLLSIIVSLPAGLLWLIYRKHAKIALPSVDGAMVIGPKS